MRRWCAVAFPVSDVKMIRMKVDLIPVDDPALFGAISQHPVPGIGSYNDVGLILDRETGQYTAYRDDCGVRAVSFDGFAIHFPNIRRPAEVVGIRVSARVTVTDGDLRPLDEPRPESMARLEDVDGDTVLSANGLKSGDQILVHDPGFEIRACDVRELAIRVREKILRTAGTRLDGWGRRKRPEVRLTHRYIRSRPGGPSGGPPQTIRPVLSKNARALSLRRIFGRGRRLGRRIT